MSQSSARLINLIEAAFVLVAQQWIAAWVVAIALAAGIVLPNQPLLKHTYLAFAFVLLVMLWVKMRGEKWSDFGLIVPRKWLRYLVLGVLLALVSIVVDSLVRSVSTPLIVSWTGANPHLDTETFAEMKGNLSLYLMVIPTIWVFAAFGEEFLFRGYLLTRLAEVLGGGRVAWALAIVGQAVVFAFGHLYQGPVGMVPIAVGGILSGVASVAWGRNLWPAIIAHGLIDTLGFTMLYLGMPTS